MANLIAPDDCDVAVIGGGPAGALTALLAAGRGLRTRLFDRATFPRDKVCGGTLNGAAMHALETAGIDVRRFESTRLSTVELRFRGAVATLPLPHHRVVARRDFDAGLLESATTRGARVETGVAARVVGEDREGVTLEAIHGDGVERVRSRCVVAADGLGSRVLAESVVASGSRIGAGAILDGSRLAVPSGVLTMAIGIRGYVGLVRLQNGAVDVAAALDPASVRAHGSLASACRAVLDEAGLDLGSELATTRFVGTPALTRRAPCVARDRVFAVGDATGYVEPFTGEGMGWAIASALALAPLLERAANGEDVAGDYRTALDRAVAARRRFCGAIAWVLRRPGCVSLAFRAIRRFPAFGNSVVARFDRLVAVEGVR